MIDVLIYVAVALALLIAGWLLFRSRLSRSVPEKLRRGKPLPDFRAADERGDPVRSIDLHGAPAVILFVRGNWCPFCNAQVKNLTRYYKDIVDLGARLILFTPKPLETTRRVGEFFEVEFDFWLDESLDVARELGLVQEGGVPKDHATEYGADTIWPTAVVTDASGIIRYVRLSLTVADRPNPRDLLKAIKQTL